MVKDWTHSTSSSNKSRLIQIKPLLLLVLLFFMGIAIGLGLREFNIMSRSQDLAVSPALGEVHFAFNNLNKNIKSPLILNQIKSKGYQAVSSTTIFNDTQTPLPAVISKSNNHLNLNTSSPFVSNQNIKSTQEAEAQAKREAEAQAKREAEAQAKREAEAQAKREAEAQAKREAEAQANRKAEAKRKTDTQIQTKPNTKSNTKTVQSPQFDQEPTSTTRRKNTTNTNQHRGDYTLQVRAFRMNKEAQKFMDTLEKKWTTQEEFYILKAKSRGKTIYRIRVGYFKTKNLARQARQRFIKIFGSQDKPFIKRIP
jgi:hypothetical protein